MQDRIEGYYDHFPPKDMQVSVSHAAVDLGNGQAMNKNILVANKDFHQGEEIYKEEPIITALDLDLESNRSHCSHCLRNIDSKMSLHVPQDPLQTAYCSKDCQTRARIEHHNLLFGLDPPLPNEPSAAPMSEQAKQDRRKAQETFVASLRSHGKVAPLIVARFVGRQVAAETSKFGSSTTGATPIASDGASNEDYSLYDHIERLRYLELPVQNDEANVISEVLKMAMPGLEQFITDERYTTLKGKVVYNAIGICYAGGRSNKPVPKLLPEDIEITRTPYGTDRQIGCGLYAVSSYARLSHSCRPSVRPSFADGTSTLHLVATRALKKGDELTMAYVDVSPGSDETVQDARLRRRKELARGWRFACMCPRCVEEGPQGGSKTPEKAEDESKVEAVVNRYEDKKDPRDGVE